MDMKTKMLVFVSIILLSLPLVSFAVAPQPASMLTVNEIVQQITAIQFKIDELKASLVESKQNLSAVEWELKTTKTLRFGMAGDEVKALQEFLSRLPDVYPEGLVTGYFGRLTEAAVKRLQEANGIETVGIVGPKTRAKLSEISSGVSGGGSPSPTAVVATESGSGNENSVGNTDSPTSFVPENSAGNHPTTTPSETVPATPAVPAEPIGQTGTTTVSATPATPAQPASSGGGGLPTTDTTAPVISNIVASATSFTAVITWTTDEPSDSRVYFSPATTTPLGSDAQYVTSHSVSLSGLSSSRTYSYVVVSKDGSGNTATSSEQSFVTLTTVPIGTPPTDFTATLSLDYGNPSSNISLRWFPASDNATVVGYSVLDSGIALGMNNTVSCSVDTDNYSQAISPGSYYFLEPSLKTNLCSAANVSPSTNYVLTMIAHYANGNVSQESNPVSITTHSTNWRSCSPVAGLNSGNLPWNVRGSVTTPDATYTDVCTNRMKGNPDPNLIEYVCWPDATNGGALGGIIGQAYHYCSNGCTNGACN